MSNSGDGNFGRRPGADNVTRRGFVAGVGSVAAGGMLFGRAYGRSSTRAGQPSTDEIRIGFTPDPKSMDPRVVWSVPGWSLVWHVCEPLVSKDRDMKLIPVLAEAWDWPNATTLRLRLRRGVRFHNGEPFDAESVKYTFDTLMDPKLTWVQAGFRDYFVALDRVAIEDRYTVSFMTKYPSRSLLTTLQCMGTVPARAGGTLGEKFGFSPIGTGPYRCVEYAPDRHVRLEAQDGYWGAPPKTRKLTYRLLSENATRLAALESREVEVINNLPPDAIPRIKRNPGLALLSTPTSRVAYLELLVDRPPLNDIRLRKAIAHAVDRQTINEAILGGLGQVATAPMSPAAFGFHGELPQYTYDPDKARALMAEAGYTKDTEIRYLYPGQRQLMSKQVGEAVAGYLQDVGFRVKSEMLDWAGYVSKAWARKGDYHVILGSYGAFTLDPDMALLYFSKRPRNGYRSPKVDKLIKSGEETFEVQKVATIYKQAQAIIWDELPWLPLYFQPELIAASRRLKGFVPRTDEFLMFTEAYLGT